MLDPEDPMPLELEPELALPPPSPPRGAAEPPPPPSPPRDTAVPVVFPLDDRSCAATFPPVRATATARVVINVDFMMPPTSVADGSLTLELSNGAASRKREE
jgi:hypothetical protein